MPEMFVRPYQPADREAFRRVAADTAFFGEPVEAFMEDRNFFLDSFYAYYTDYEPEHIWAAEVDGQVVGFIAAAVDTRQRDQTLYGRIVPRLLLRLTLGKYHFGRRALGYYTGLLMDVLRARIPHVDLDRYPAHLHINMDAGWRGLGMGRRLMEAHLEQMRELGVRGVHLQTTSLNEAAVGLYERLGFRLVDRRESELWGRLAKRRVENLLYVLVLDTSKQ